MRTARGRQSSKHVPGALILVEDQKEARDKRTLCVQCVRCMRVGVSQNLDDAVLDVIDDVLDATDLLVIVGTSSVVYPAAGYAPQVAQR